MKMELVFLPRFPEWLSCPLEVDTKNHFVPAGTDHVADGKQIQEGSAGGARGRGNMPRISRRLRIP